MIVVLSSADDEKRGPVLWEPLFLCCFFKMFLVCIVFVCGIVLRGFCMCAEAVYLVPLCPEM